MKKLLLIFTFFIEYCFSADNWEIMLNHCCNIGKTWSMDTKSCNISLTIPISDVPNEHNSMCLTTVGACCLHSLREIRCNEGKQIGLENGICNDKSQLGKNQIDFMVFIVNTITTKQKLFGVGLINTICVLLCIMCCEICKIGSVVGSTKTICQSIPFFNNHQWGEVYQSCCNTAITKVKSISTEIKKNNDTAGLNQCIDGTHNCKPEENCIRTSNGFYCHIRSVLKPLSTYPEKYKKKDNCNAGYAYDAYDQKCKDIDECIQRPCEVNELCENTLGSFKCHCKNGFQLDEVTNACTDINECQLNLHTCQESQRCDNTVGSYQCVRFTGCGTGYTLNVESALCIDDDECVLKTDNCSIMGPEWICRNTLGSFRCEKKRCTKPNCRVQQSGLNNTTVNPGTMKCFRGYETDNNNKCIDINECRSPNRCSKNDVCINTNGSYYCLPRSRNY